MSEKLVEITLHCWAKVDEVLHVALAWNHIFFKATNLSTSAIQTIKTPRAVCYIDLLSF
jgi:hypothetical protein